MTRAAALALTVLLSNPVLAQPSVDDGIYSLQQAISGQRIYARECALCHGAGLEGGEAGGALLGEGFRDEWRDRSLMALFEVTQRTMPVSRPAL